MKLRTFLRVVGKDTYLIFETNNYSSLGACYKDDFKKDFKSHPYLDLDILEIRSTTIRTLFTEKVENALLITFRG